MPNIIQEINQYNNERNNSPVSSTDYNKTKNDWTSLIGYHLFEGSSKEDRKVSFEEFRTTMSIVAALAIRAIEVSYDHENTTSDTTKIISKIKEEQGDE